MQKKYIVSYSYLRIFACLAVVLLHLLNASTIYYFKEMSVSQATIVGQILHQTIWAVPCFLMITGALLLNPEKEIPMKKIVGKYIRRVLMALIVFTFIFQCIDYGFHEEHEIFLKFFTNLFTGYSWPHMWYLYLMIFIYLLLPFFKIITKYMDDRMLIYLVVLMLIFNSIIPIITAFKIPNAFQIYNFVIYPIYLFLGYLIHKKGLPKLSCVILIICGTVGIVLATTLKPTDGVKAFYDYASPFVIMQAMGIFGLFDQWKISTMNPVVHFLDSTTFGVYLIHFIFVKVVMKFLHFNPYHYGIWVFFVMMIVFFICSSLITALIRKIPKLQLL